MSTASERDWFNSLVHLARHGYAFNSQAACYFYVVNGGGSVHKVGMGRSVLGRLSAHQVGNAHELTLSAFCLLKTRYQAGVLERAVLTALEPKRLRGEWVDEPIGGICRVAREQIEKHRLTVISGRDALMGTREQKWTCDPFRHELKKLLWLRVNGVAREIEPCYKNDDPALCG